MKVGLEAHAPALCFPADILCRYTYTHALYIYYIYLDAMYTIYAKYAKYTMYTIYAM